MNIRIVDGRLVKDAEIRTDKKGKKFLSFVLANNQFVNKEKIATYFNVITYNNYDIEREESNKWLKQGKFITVTGVPNENMSVKNGKTYLNRNIMADRVEFGYDPFKRENELNETQTYRDVAPSAPIVEIPQVDTPTIASNSELKTQIQNNSNVSVKSEVKNNDNPFSTSFDEDELPF